MQALIRKASIVSFTPLFAFSAFRESRNVSRSVISASS
jgi:hypothetical protein